MSAVPVFEIGVWNAWILTVIFLCFFISSPRFGNIGQRIAHGEPEKKISKFIAPIAIILWIYSIFLPLKTGTAWFYTGLLIYILGMIIGIMAVISIATTQPDKPYAHPL